MLASRQAVLQARPQQAPCSAAAVQRYVTAYRCLSPSVSSPQIPHAAFLHSPSPAAPSSNVRCCSTAKPVATEDDVVRYAAVGDTVSVHFRLLDTDGNLLRASMDDLDEPISFEVGAGEMMGNRLFQGFDEAVRGMAVGQTTVMEATGGEWKRELLFAVPRDHPEVLRLEGRYKNQGGLAPGLVVELSNGGMACVLEVGDAEVKLDANNMMAGKTFTIELELVSIETGDRPPAAASEAAAAAPAQ